MAALIREPPRRDGPARRVSLRALERRARRLRDRAEVGRRRSPAGGGLLERRVGRGDHRLHRREFAPRAARRGRCRRGHLTRAGSSCRQAGGAVVVRGRARACAAGRARGPATPARSTRSRPGCCSCCPAGQPSSRVLRRAGQAVPDRRRPARGHGRRAIREGELLERARAAGRGRARAAARGPPRRGRAAGPGRLGGQDRRRARLPAAPARCRGRDAAAAVAGRRARRHLV